jgi:hypothetical protein
MTKYGVPISSWRLYFFPTDVPLVSSATEAHSEAKAYTLSRAASRGPPSLATHETANVYGAMEGCNRKTLREDSASSV